MPTNRELEIIMRLKDEASKRLEGIKGNLRRFASAWKENWLAISAAITASIMALRKAWDLMEKGAKAEQIEQSFTRMAESVCVDAREMRAAIMEASKETVNFSNVADKVSALLAQGLKMDQVTALMRQARVEARIFGTTTEEAFSNISSAVTGGLVTTLRRTYGLQLSLKEAVEEFAKATGKTTEEVQKYHMAQALANHILSQSKAHLEAVNLEMMTNYEKVQKLKAVWTDFSERLGQSLWHVLGFVQGLINNVIAGFFTILKVCSGVIQKVFINPLVKLYDLLGKLPGKMGETYRQMGSNMKELASEMEINRQAFEMSSRESAKVAMDQYDLVFASVKSTGDNTAEYLKNVSNQLGDTAKSAAKQFNAMEEFAKQSARNIQNAFSEFFFKTFTGELNNVKEIFADFGRAILQMISNIMAKILLIKAFTALAGPSGLIFGIDVGDIFHQGGIVKKHQGGIIRAHSGLAVDEVPIIAQTGEGILSRQGMSALGRSNFDQLNRGEGLNRKDGQVINFNPVVVIKAWDATDIYRHKDEIRSIITESLRLNGSVRGAIKRYIR